MYIVGTRQMLFQTLDRVYKTPYSILQRLNQAKTKFAWSQFWKFNTAKRSGKVHSCNF